MDLTKIKALPWENDLTFSVYVCGIVSCFRFFIFIFNLLQDKLLVSPPILVISSLLRGILYFLAPLLPVPACLSIHFCQLNNHLWKYFFSLTFCWSFSFQRADLNVASPAYNRSGNLIVIFHLYKASTLEKKTKYSKDCKGGPGSAGNLDGRRDSTQHDESNWRATDQGNRFFKRSLVATHTQQRHACQQRAFYHCRLSFNCDFQ